MDRMDPIPRERHRVSTQQLEQRERTDKAAGLGRKEIEPCGLCGRGLMASGDLATYRIGFEMFMADPQAIRREHGADLMMGPLATVMGRDEKLYTAVTDHVRMLVCQPCMMSRSLAEVFEAVSEQTADEPESEGA